MQNKSRYSHPHSCQRACLQHHEGNGGDSIGKRLEALAITEHAPEMPGSCCLYYFKSEVVPGNAMKFHFAGSRIKYYG